MPFSSPVVDCLECGRKRLVVTAPRAGLNDPALVVADLTGIDRCFGQLRLLLFRCFEVRSGLTVPV